MAEKHSTPRADLDAAKAAARVAAAAATASEQRLRALAGRVPGGDSENYIPTLCDFLAAEYGWGVAVIAGLDDRQMVMFVEQALRRRAQNRPEEKSPRHLDAHPVDPPPVAKDTAPPARLSRTQTQILQLVKDAALPGKTIAASLRLKHGYVRNVLAGMMKAGLLTNGDDGYRARVIK
jgi:hypothetical protein